ncbi:MAG: NAD+ synthase [Pseudomonadota bacterium]
MNTRNEPLPLRIELIQFNPKVGDLQANTDAIVQALEQSVASDLVVFPELALTGYPPEDLLNRPAFLDEVDERLEALARRCPQQTFLVGVPRRAEGRLYNVAVLVQAGELKSVYRKRVLPNYGVFDERRYFSEGQEPGLVDVGGRRIGLCLCEDLWRPQPSADLAEAGAEAILSLNASPFHVGKQAERETTARQRAEETGLAVAYVNLWGGQDEVVFDGGSFATDERGALVARAPACADARLSLSLNGGRWQCDRPPAPAPGGCEELYTALVTGLRDYIDKNGFPGVVLGLSGGIDSALVLAVAVDALGSERVHAIMMPSRYTSQMSLEDADRIAANFGVDCHRVSIEDSFHTMLDGLAPLFGDAPVDTAEENLQARIRGTLLMAVSNKRGWLVLPTGNKSEYAVGYSTLYGDMVGGYAPLKDVSKTRVFELCEWRNRDGETIPQRIIDRPPSAELAPDQKDEDSLPPYEVLDQILALYIEQAQSPADIVAKGFDEAAVKDTVRRVNLNEYKRRQAAPGPKVTPCAFGRERRYPITSGFWR